MSLQGVMQKIAWVHLATGDVFIEQPPEDVYTRYLGGYGLGAYYLFTRQRPHAEPLGPDNILGLTTGTLTGTPAIGASRFIAVGKSPKTGGWGDANCGGTFGPALKQAGVDAVFFTGISDRPAYAVVENGKVTLHDASDLWGLSTSETEARLQERHGPQSRVAAIGPSGERCSLLASIMTDNGRAAARSGLGAVMGSKRIKAVVAIASGAVPVAEPEKIKDLRRQLLKDFYRKGNTSFDFFRTYGTSGGLEPNVLMGDAPVKNWGGCADDFPAPAGISGDALLAYKSGSYGCWQCPVACGAKVRVGGGPYAVESMRPEYETLAAFGPMCLNHNAESICYLNNLCNEAGLDTISVGTTIAYAIECFENGLITTDDTGGLALTWGNHEAIVETTRQMASGEGFGGTVLADGIQKAVERIGVESAAYAMHCGGEELPLHDPRFYPGLAASYTVAPAAGHHTEYGTWFVEKNMLPPNLGHPELADKYRYTGKGKTHKYLSCYGQVVNAAGLCFFAANIAPAETVPTYLTLATGKPHTMDSVLATGERIATLRHMFNLREGIRCREHCPLPDRVLGRPPLADGPTRDITVDADTQIRDYFIAMGWNPVTGIPKSEVLKNLGLDFTLHLAELPQ